MQPSLSALSTALQAGRVKQERIKQQRIQPFTQAGTVRFTMSGTLSEATFQVAFPDIFVAKPIFTFGSELDWNQPLVQGSFPQVSATVWSWLTVPGPGAWVGYSGANIAVSASGTNGLAIIIHYSFQGRAQAFNAPSSPSNGTGAA